MRSTSESMGTGEFVWFVGRVVDRDDPLFIGRVRVRCYSWHPDEIDDADLPWAQVISPVLSGSYQNIGHTPLGLIEGSTVVGFFMDGRAAQVPMVLGAIPGVTDDIPDMHELARPKTLEDIPEPVKTRNDALTIAVPTARGGSWTEPAAGWSSLATLYPYNIVYSNGQGYTREVDGSPGNERVAEYTKAGGYREVNASGDQIVKIVGDNYTIIAGSDHVSVSGDANLTVSGTLRIKAESLDIETGSYTLKVSGEALTEYAGDSSFTYGVKRIMQKGDTYSRHEAGTDYTNPDDPVRTSDISAEDVATP